MKIHQIISPSEVISYPYISDFNRFPALLRFYFIKNEPILCVITEK